MLTSKVGETIKTFGGEATQTRFHLNYVPDWMREREREFGGSVNVHVWACMCVCVSLSHAGQAAMCATMLCDCTAVSINLDSKGSDHVCLSSFVHQHQTVNTCKGAFH